MSEVGRSRLRLLPELAWDRRLAKGSAVEPGRLHQSKKRNRKVAKKETRVPLRQDSSAVKLKIVDWS